MTIYTGVLERAAASVTMASAGLFAALSKARGKRFFHPEGITCEGTLTFLDTDLDLPFAGATPAQARLSRGAGLPGRLPDVFGLAVKLPEFDHDFLLATSGDSVVTRHLLLPGTGVFHRPYSSILPYELGDDLVVFGARADDALRQTEASAISEIRAVVASGRLRFDLTMARVGSSGSTVFGSLVLEQIKEEEIKFNPWNCRPPLRPAGPLNQLRLETYQASQAARPDTTAIGT